MGLATRCSSCGTIFRVVQDQLKVSEGWVRCGRCQEVFNALQNLFDLEREAPPPWPPVPATEPPQTEWDRTRPVRPPEPAFAAPSGDHGTASTDPAELTTQPLLHTASRDLADNERGSDPEDTGFEDARFNEDLIEEALIGQQEEREEEEEELEVFGASQLEPLPAPRRVPKAAPAEDAPPRFIVEAERAARWQRPGVRAALMLALLLLGAGLLAQVGLHWRDELVAHWPQSRSVLAPLCAAAHCSIQAPRRLESLSLDSSGLAPMESPGQYRLSVVLRNRGRAPVLLPALELSLTDRQGELISRRALLPAELGARQDSLTAGAELPLQAAFSVGELRVVGYSVEIFYP